MTETYVRSSSFMMQLLTTTLALLFLALAANTATAKRRSNLLHLQSLSRHYRGDNIFDNTIYPYETKHYNQKVHVVPRMITFQLGTKVKLISPLYHGMSCLNQLERYPDSVVNSRL